jgi:hypothetical protein
VASLKTYGHNPYTCTWKPKTFAMGPYIYLYSSYWNYNTFLATSHQEDLGCVWYSDFVEKKCDFKPNRRKWIIWDCDFKNLRFEKVKNMCVQIADN